MASLWLPILLSAAAVFIVSSVLHTALPWHKNDYRRLPGEGALRAAWDGQLNPPGDYMVPSPNHGETMRSESWKERMRQGPLVVMTVLPNGIPNMARHLIQWFVYLLVISFLAALTACNVLGPGSRLGVFHVVALCAFLGYAGALGQASIWYRRSWATTLRSTLDGFIFGLITGGIFLWLWPR